MVIDLEIVHIFLHFLQIDRFPSVGSFAENVLAVLHVDVDYSLPL